MKKCKYCQKEIDSKAKICPNCRKKQGNFFENHVVLTIILAFIALSTINSLLTNNTEETPSKGASSGTRKVTEEKTYNIGDIITNKKYEITIISVTTKKEVGGEYLKSNPADGGIYICVDYTLKNISEEPMSSFSFSSINLIDSKKTKYSADISASSYYATETDPNKKILSDLNPGITVKDSDVFEVSEDSYNNDSWNLLIDNKINVKVK